ncbi:MAG: rRNA maturation RNase YbeY [Bacteroidota bacterium]
MIKNIKVNSEDNIKIDKKLVHSICGMLLQELNVSVESLPVNFVTPETIGSINENYLNHRGTTDIITFNYSGDNDILDGEIFISVRDAAENAAKFGCTVESEILRLIVHGFLHLKGYDDIDKKDRKIMKQEEDRLTVKLDFLTKNILLNYDYKNC